MVGDRMQESIDLQDTLNLYKSEVRDLSFYYGDFNALKGINMVLHEKKVTALIGPSGCGKSTFLRCFNRMHDLYPGNRYVGDIILHPGNVNILASDVDPIEVRMRISMVFQKPNPFPKSIYENVAYGLRVRGVRQRAVLDEKVEEALRDAALWDEVKDRLNQLAFNLSVVSNSVYALHVLLLQIQKSCSLTSPLRHLTRSRPPVSRSLSLT